ncbi:MAG TPA: peptidoglycan DD-metalloendopeptidase family protein [Thermoanaerobaculia bacterium]|nr:peptidoglycan DD-metalloendopeptidase family protein [Thermoanaerobaculia bacterium]
MSRGSLVVRLLRVGVPVGLLLVALALASTSHRLEAFSRSPYPLTRTLPFRAAVDLRPGGDLVAATGDERVPVELVLDRGETLQELLGRIGLDRQESQAVAAAFREHCNLRRLRPGDALSAYLEPDGPAGSFELAVADRGRVTVARSDDGGWAGRFDEYVEERRVRAVAGLLADGALTTAVVDAGAPAELAFAMAEVLQWDLDFNRDLRRGDRFEVLFEEVFLDGRARGVGEVLALTYHNRGQLLEAYRFGDEPAYYDGDGRPLQKMFLRSPLPFTRVTSRFSHRRFHPVLKTYRPHYGVDYGAPVGTPVRATARGTVLSAGWSGGGGKMVKLRHANGYLSAYLHLSGFAAGIRAGARVAQGDVIGYVGATGLATAAHLDYRVQHGGRWIDPLGLKGVEAEPLGRSDLQAFVAWRDALRESLASGAQPRLGPDPRGRDLRLASGDGERAEGLFHPAG